MKLFQITYANGNSGHFAAECIADFFENPEHWFMTKDSLRAIVKIEQISN